MGLFDVHAHLTHPRLAPDVDAVLDRARAAGVTCIVVNGLNPADNEKVLALARRDATVRPGLGLYPVDAVLPEMLEMGHSYPRDEEGPMPRAEEAIAWVEAHASEAFAIGEIGLDGYWVPEALWERQEWAFRELVKIAMAADKPVIVHTRKRERRAFEVLRELGATRVDWHCFGGKVNLAREIGAHGHYMSIPANARRSETFTRMIETLPRDRLLLETDCPYLSPDKSRASEPADVAGTADYVAELWKTSRAEVAERLAENFTRLFGTEP